jgi:5-methylcytosine-specific restriction protein B
VSAQLFERTLGIRRVGLVQLTMGLFWMRPDQYLAIDKRNRAFLEKRGIEPNINDWKSYLGFLNQVKTQLPGLSWPELSYKAYRGEDGERNGPPPSPIDYWKVAPGDDAWQWNECRDNNFIAVGWDEFGDLSGVDSGEFEKRCTRLLAKHPEWTRKGCEQLWKFSQIKAGDRIVANHGTTKVLGIGTVIGPYFYVPNADYGHRLPVKWDDLRQRDVEKGGWTRTLVSLSEEEFKRIINLLPPPDPPRSDSTNLNTILYGPPGTGKTYNTIERAVRTIEPQLTGDHPAYKARFDALRQKGRIEFITLHQSYSYEDFVEGLRPVTDPEEESTEARYRYCPGVFKRIAVQALFDCLKPASPDAGATSFDAVWNKLVEQTELDPERSYPGLTEKTAYRISLTPRGNLEGINTISNKQFLCPRSILEKVYAAKPKGKSISSSEVMEIIVRGCHSHFIAAIFNELKRIEKGLPAAKQSPPAASFSWEQKAEIVQGFLNGRAAGAYVLKPAAEWPRYALVIDEINRGNVSKILGELITLIEADKRVGAEHSLVVKLPYTQEYFAVPGNLHIIGTMNTADKSIALVDVALRRRFQFEELRPNFDHCANLTSQMREALQSLNRRICLRKDRDHQIGHSYFMSVSSESGFNRVFEMHVIPLLQEYFYNDWEGLRFVLGEKNKKGVFIKPLDGCEGAEARTKWQWASDASNNEAVNCLQALLGHDQTI